MDRQMVTVLAQAPDPSFSILLVWSQETYSTTDRQTDRQILELHEIKDRKSKVFVALQLCWMLSSSWVTTISARGPVSCDSDDFTSHGTDSKEEKDPRVPKYFAALARLRPSRLMLWNKSKADVTVSPEHSGSTTMTLISYCLDYRNMLLNWWWQCLQTGNFFYFFIVWHLTLANNCLAFNTRQHGSTQSCFPYSAH